jgi:ent-kaurene oxidase
VGFFRRLRREVTFSDGVKLPKGSLIGVQVYSISMDPEVYDEPEKFDGLRFYKLRQSLGSEDR